jgi:hypothetical protein
MEVDNNNPLISLTDIGAGDMGTCYDYNNVYLGELTSALVVAGVTQYKFSEKQYIITINNRDYDQRLFKEVTCRAGTGGKSKRRKSKRRQSKRRQSKRRRSNRK